MEQRTEQALSPYNTFSRAQWAALRQDAPMTLTSSEITRLRSLHDRLDIAEVEEIYLPLSRLLSIYVEATQRLFVVQRRFLSTEDHKMPYIIGVAGSVAERAEGRSHHHRRLSLSQRGSRTRRPDGEEGFSGKLRSAGTAALSHRRKGRPPPGARADLFTSDL